MQTSIHFRPVVAGSEIHNKREKTLDYVNVKRTKDNEHWQADTQSNRLATIKQIVKDKTGRTLQDKATPIREGVIVIKSDTTMKDLKELASKFKSNFGIEIFQISIHRDEGHYEDGAWKPNLHAHVVADWTNHNTGKSCKLNKNDMCKMQTMTAEVLHMERGVTSDKKHLNAVAFKIAEKQKELDELMKREEMARKELKDLEDRASTKKQAKNAISSALGRFSEWMDNTSMSAKISDQEQKNKAKDEQITELKREFHCLIERNGELEKELSDTKAALSRAEEKLSSQFSKGFRSAEKQAEERIDNLEKRIEQMKDEAKTFLETMCAIPAIRKAAEMVVEVAMKSRGFRFNNYQSWAIKKAVELAPDNKGTILNAIEHVANHIKPNEYGAADWVENAMNEARNIAHGTDTDRNISLKR